ncbi:ATP-binding cassette domain-containing protein [Chitinivorax sp. B]|uniref:ABC transporter ATP-binding protein n=1 Tax=Chitinivorax sp. B TaxID=2502235 RepID=UPI0010F44260|nr:ATP-binding cassette domain-containing protein [Chitinivorax sp. B]
MSTAPAISVELRNIVQQYPARDGSRQPITVINDVSLRFDKPGINMLLGPSGCGKSTLLHMMGGVRPFGVDTPTTGEVLIDGQPCTAAHDDVVMVFQRYANRPDLTVWDNVALPFRFARWRQSVPQKEWTDRVDAMLEAVGLADRKRNLPGQLSGGQNQRVALARALVLRPRILLMDEPFGALDAQTRAEMQQLLAKLHHDSPCLTIFVTHDVTEALILGDRVIVLSTQPAKIADDFNIHALRPRGEQWLRSAEAIKMEERVLATLHSGNRRGTVAVSV